jgi:tRNA (cytidine/uridine-2'-O-)-methyltransferase
MFSGVAMLTLFARLISTAPERDGYDASAGNAGEGWRADSGDMRGCQGASCPPLEHRRLCRHRQAMRIALFEPEIAQNVGAVLRLGACLGVAVDLIEPMGFAWDDRRVRRTAMDYIDHVEIARHASFDAFQSTSGGRHLLMTTKGTSSTYDFRFEADDILIFGKESGGVPDEVAARCDHRLRIPIRSGVRSFNLATSAALALGEALRQTGLLPR